MSIKTKYFTYIIQYTLTTYYSLCKSSDCYRLYLIFQIIKLNYSGVSVLPRASIVLPNNRINSALFCLHLLISHLFCYKIDIHLKFLTCSSKSLIYTASSLASHNISPIEQIKYLTYIIILFFMYINHLSVPDISNSETITA